MLRNVHDISRVDRPLNRYLLEHSRLPLKISRAFLERDFAMHQHDFSELVIITGGSAIHTIDGVAYPIHRGDIYVLHGDTAHGFNQPDQLELFNIMYDPAIFTVLQPELRKMPGFQALFVLEPIYRRQDCFKHHLHLSPGQMALPLDLLHTMQMESDALQEGNEQALLSYFQAMVAFLCRVYSLEKPGQDCCFLPLARAFAQIEQNYLQPLSVSAIAAEIPMSLRHFIRIFRLTYQTTPTDYIIRLRLEHARRLLQAGGLCITEAAAESGFPDSNYFSRQFRRHYGMPPRDYLRFLQGARRR
jgi:AraC family L-rhamnose operon transcriptional activator RhaR/AraC family L-rhamnose operon regulatory protein RhaS